MRFEIKKTLHYLGMAVEGLAEAVYSLLVALTILDDYNYYKVFRQ